MIQDRLRLIGLAVLVFLVVPYLVLRHLDKADKARESLEGKTVIVHYWGVPAVPVKIEDQITIAVYRNFLDKPENRDVVIKRFSGLEIRDLPASWDAMMQMAFAADRAPDVLQLVTENIQTHREEQFVRPLPDAFTFVYSNAAYDDDSGYRQEAVAEIRQERRRQEAIFHEAAAKARAAGLPEGQWLPQAAGAFDRAMIRTIRQIHGNPDNLLAGRERRLAELLEIWDGLAGKAECGRANAECGIPNSELRIPNSELECPTGQAWHRWLFEKLQAKIPGDLLRALYDMQTGRLYGVDEGEPGLMGIQYRLKPFREANLVDRAGKILLPGNWDELEFWSIAISLMGDGLTTEGKIGYKLAHGQLIPYPFPLYAYGAGGLMVVQNQEGAWTCALDSPGTIRGMTWVRRMAFLRPIKIDLRAVNPQGQEVTYPLVVIYDKKSPFETVPDFYLRSVSPADAARYYAGSPAPGEIRQVVIRRLTLTDDYRVLDGEQELFRFASRRDLIDRLKGPASQSPGQCVPVRRMDKSDYVNVQQRLWDEDKLAMMYTATSTLVVQNPDAEGRTQHPDGPPWDVMVTEDELADRESLAGLQADLARLGVRADLTIAEQDWPAVAAFQRELATVQEPAERDRLKQRMPAPLRAVLGELARHSMPADLYYPHVTLRPARPHWADVTDVDVDRGGRWSWVHLVSPDGRTIVTVQHKYVRLHTEYEAWPGGPRFRAAPVAVEGGMHVQFACGLQTPAAHIVRKDTHRIQAAVVDMGMLALNHRLNERTEEDRNRLDACVRLLGYLTSDEAEKIQVDAQVRNGLGLRVNPVLLRKYATPRNRYDQIADQIPAGYEEAMRNIRRIGRAVPPVPNYRGFQQFLSHLGDRVIIEGEDPAEACRTVTATVNKRFLTEPDPQVMVQRRKVAWVVFAAVVLCLLVAAVWIGRQLLRGVSAHTARSDAELGSVGQRPTWRTHLAAWLFLGPAVLTIFIWSYLPLGWGSVMAFQDFHVVRPTTVVGLDNFIRIFVDPQFYKILYNTFHYVFLALSLGFLAPIILALMLHEIPRGKIFFRTVYYLPAITSGLVILLMWKQFYDPDKAGLLNSLLTGMNSFDPATVFVLKTLGIVALPAVILVLFALPMMDNIETPLGRAIALLPPLIGILWLGYRAPGPLFSLPTGLAQSHLFGLPGPLAVYGLAAAGCLAVGLVLLARAYRCETEFASRRLPWAAPGIAALFVAGWLIRLAGAGLGADEVSPLMVSSHMAQLFVLMLPVMGAWPILRMQFGREHAPRETMYLLLRQGAAPAALFSRRDRRISVSAGGLILAVSLAGFWVPGSPTATAHRYLLGSGVGWLLHPMLWQAMVAAMAALILARRGGLAAAVFGTYLLTVALFGLAPVGEAVGRLMLGRGGGWLCEPFVIEPLAWLKDRDLAMICIILPGVWAHMGPGCLIYLAGLKSIPEDVYEAADLDGAGAFQKVWTITLPHLMALLIINFVGAFIGAFQTSQNILVMTAGGPADATMVLSLQVWLDAFVLLKFGYATALAWILGLMLIGFTMYQISILKKVQFKTSGMK